MRKILVVLCAVLVITNTFAAVSSTYYVSTAGSDANTTTQAKSQSTPWKTVAKINALLSSATIVAGDTVLLRAGDIFTDTLNISKGIYLGSYGVGAKPVISGMYTITTWTSLGGGIYESEVIPTSIPLNMVTINNTPVAVGRYPNADASNGGYLIFESHSQVTSSDPDTITDNTHIAALDNTWAGAQLVMKTTLSNISTATIASVSGTTNTVIGYSSLTPTWTLSNNYGYFVQKSIKALDQFGEWYFNPSTKKIDVYFGSGGPASNVVQVATKDKMVLAGTSNITIKNIAIQGGNYGIYNQISSLSALTIDYCDLSYFGFDAIAYRGITHSSVTNCKINWVHSCGMNLWNSNTYIDILNNTVSNVGMFPGHTAKDIGSIASIGIATASSDSVTLKYNTLKNGGHHGIRFDEANNYLCQYNTIDSFLQVMDDGGSIYFWVSTSPKGALHDRYILNNIVTNAIDNEYGAPAGTSYYGGIYGDDRVYNVVIQNNSVSNGNGAGLFLHNVHDITIRDNILYNNSNAFVTQHDASTVTMNNISLKNNRMLATTTGQTITNLRSSWNDFNVMFSSLDSNYYGRARTDSNAFVRNWFSNSTLNYDFPGWKTFTAAEAHSARTNIADMSKVIFNTNSRRVNSTLHFCAACMGLDNQPLFNRLPMNAFTSVLMLKSN